MSKAPSRTFALRRLSIGQRLMFNPLLTYTLPLLLLALLPYYYSGQAWSPFQLFGEKPNYETLYSYLWGATAFAGGYLAMQSAFRKQPDKSSEYLLLGGRLDAVISATFFINVLSFVISQAVMGDANLYQIYSGNVSALQIEDAILASPPGVHGVSLLAAFASLMVWVMCRLGGRGSALAAISLALGCLQFLAKGKAQGLLYVLAAFVLVSRSSFPLARLFVGVLIVAAIFLATRFIRNVEQEYVLSEELVQAIVFGVYLGSPVANTNHIYTHVSEFWNPYFLYSHAIPPRLLDRPQSLIDAMPDPTSPAGVIGAALAAAGLAGVVVYGAFIGLMSGFIYCRAERDIAMRVFLPFMFVTNVFAVMYNHYANLTFFWIPLLFVCAAGYGCMRRVSPAGE